MVRGMLVVPTRSRTAGASRRESGAGAHARPWEPGAAVLSRPILPGAPLLDPPLPQTGLFLPPVPRCCDLSALYGF